MWVTRSVSLLGCPPQCLPIPRSTAAAQAQRHQVGSPSQKLPMMLESSHKARGFPRTLFTKNTLAKIIFLSQKRVFNSHFPLQPLRKLAAPAWSGQGFLPHRPRPLR